MIALTNLEYLITLLVAYGNKKHKHGSITTTSGYVPLATVSTPANMVMISNTTSKVLYVKFDGNDFYIPAGGIIPFNNIIDLTSVSVKLDDNTAGTTITFAYEY